MQLGRFFEIRFVVYKIGSTISIFPPSFHSSLFWISRHDDDSRGNLAARLGTEIGVDCRNLVPALLNLRPPIPIFFHGAACYTAKLTHLSRGKEREREREENRATMYPIPAGQDCVSLKKTARVAFTACHLLATRNRATSRFFFFLILIILASTLIAIALENAVGRKQTRNRSILIWVIATLRFRDCHFFKVSPSLMHNRTCTLWSVGIHKGVKRWRDWRGKRTQLETRCYDTSS